MKSEETGSKRQIQNSSDLAQHKFVHVGMKDLNMECRVPRCRKHR